MSTQIEAKVRRGTYEATLRVAKQGSLAFSLRGPDMRYRWGSGTIALKDVDRYKAGLLDALTQLTELRSAAPPGVEMTKMVYTEGLRFDIATSGFRFGITVFPNSENSWECMIKNKADLDYFAALLDEAVVMNEKLAAILI